MLIIAINRSFIKHINRGNSYYCCYCITVVVLCDEYVNFSNVEWPSSLPVALIMSLRVSKVISGIEWSSSGPYFDGSFLVADIMFRSVVWIHYLSNNTHAKYHSSARHTYPLTEVILSRSDARPLYWMKATAVAFASLPTRCEHHSSGFAFGIDRYSAELLVGLSILRGKSAKGHLMLTCIKDVCP